MFFITIPGKPIAKKQLRCSCIGGKPRIYQPSSKDQSRLAKLFKQAAGGRPPYACPIKWTVHLFIPIPKSINKMTRMLMQQGKIRPDKRPDDDNYAYILSNAASGSFYDDDCRRCESHIFKWYDDGNGPRTTVEVDALDSITTILRKTHAKRKIEKIY